MDTTYPREIDRWLGSYSEDHRDPINQVIHLICVPLILWSVMALLWSLPVPALLGRPGFWAGMAMFLSLLYYWRLSRPLGLGMLLAYLVLGIVTHLLFGMMGMWLAWLAMGVFVTAWIGQFIGHMIEGRRPSFLTDLQYLLIGPLWTLSKLFKVLRLRW
jgi:uncharacterized membrane protein YGL010W